MYRISITFSPLSLIWSLTLICMVLVSLIWNSYPHPECRSGSGSSWLKIVTEQANFYAVYCSVYEFIVFITKRNKCIFIFKIGTDTPNFFIHSRCCLCGSWHIGWWGCTVCEAGSEDSGVLLQVMWRLMSTVCRAVSQNRRSDETMRRTIGRLIVLNVCKHLSLQSLQFIWR